MNITLSDRIRMHKGGVVDNPFQGKDKKVLFVCSMGLLRSATGARMYARKYNTRAAGSWEDALVPLTPILLAWANEIVFVNRENYMDMMHKFGEEVFLSTPTKVLDIPDEHTHMHPDLVKAFEEQYEVL